MIDQLVRTLDPRMRRFCVHFVIGDVTLVLKNAYHFGLQLRVRDKDFHLLRVRAVAHASKQICNWICNGTHEIEAACSAGVAGPGLAGPTFFARSAKGIPNSLKSDLASSSVRAVVTIVTSKPMLRLILSISISGKIV